ncbi:hypothetical protein G6F59_004009 [Rhizopus arrhizus]|nr:hypothetical protein G6F59_004009 [Rhizopus arrhizus]
MAIGYEVLTAPNHGQDIILHTISHSKGYGQCWRQTHRLILDYQSVYYEIYKIVLVTDYPFVTWLTRSFEWVSFCPRVYRQTQLDSLLPCPASIIPPDGWLRFWKLTILPEARSFSFRFIHGKLHSQSSVARFNPDISVTCKFCNVPSEDISHLLVECPHKWSIWQEALSRFAPHLEFQSTDILTLLLHLTRFDYIDNTTLLRLSYYILLFLWRAHWRYIFDNVPLLPERIVTTAFEKIGMLSLH